MASSGREHEEVCASLRRQNRELELTIEESEEIQARMQRSTHEATTQSGIKDATISQVV